MIIAPAPFQSAAAPASPVPRPGTEFSPQVEARLQDFIDRVESGEIDHPLAVFDFDGTMSADDIGERFLEWQIENRRLVDVDYSKDLYGEYEQAVRRDHGTGYAKAVQMMAGQEESEVRKDAQAFAQGHVDRNAFPAQRKLVQRLQAAGADVWIVSASGQILVEAVAPLFGIPSHHAIGIRTAVRGGVLTDEVVGPITYRPGKVDAIDETIGRRPDLAAGNAWTDYEMLESAGSLVLLINPDNRGEDSLQSRAEARNWAVQRWD